jgi:hydrogenase-4 component B
MDATQLLMLCVLIFAGGGAASLLLCRFSLAARATAGLTGAIASLVGLVGAAQAIASGPTKFKIPGMLPFGDFVVRLDGLSILMVGIICLVGLAVGVYSISYLGQYEMRNVAALGFFANLFMAAMLMVVIIANAFYFLIFWEMMTLASYFLVIFEGEKKDSILAGFLYMLVAHAGTALIMLAFFILYGSAGSFDFGAFRQTQLPSALRGLVFVLAFIGFGAKAGIVPLHIWLPRAHPAAPSSGSALLSGVMIKIAIYGVLRICVDLLGVPSLWWGLLVLIFGALSAILGVFYALAESDIKRILAYSSVENIGIILLGIGTGMIGMALRQPFVALLGFLAALYHALNHALFKALLFLGAGSVEYRLHTHDLNEMGGLARRMPWTGLTFLIGALGLSAIPPLNGFVSEWFTYQAFLAGSSSGNLAVRVLLPLCGALLALVGALAAMVAIKSYGGAFTGPARSGAAARAIEVPGLMLSGMTFLALGCILLGLGAPLVAPYLAGVAAQTLNVPEVAVASGLWVFPAQAGQSVLSTPLVAILLLGLLIVPAGLVAIYSRRHVGSRLAGEPWACGYRYSSRMSVTATSFDQPVAAAFGGIYWLRAMTRGPLQAVAGFGRRAREAIARGEPLIERLIRQPTTQAVDGAGRETRKLQMGDIRWYCLYIVATLAILLIVLFS